MEELSISEVAQRTGFTPSTLRFYDQSGLVSPRRSAAGYRRYDQRSVERLQFIGRAKGFGLSLDEITELLALLDEGRCAPVHERLQVLVDTKIADAQVRAAELTAFTGELRDVAAALEHHPPADGPCDETCACTDDHSEGPPPNVDVVTKESVSADPPIICTLSPNDMLGRLADWEATLSSALERTPIDGGVAYRFSPETDVAGLASLAAAEQRCCQFLTFGLTIGLESTTLAITGPPDARPLLEQMAEMGA